MTAGNIKENGRLATLPPELLSQIVSHIETARALSHLSKTCKRIHTFVEQDGFRVFAQTRFPYFQPPTIHSASFWKDAAHGLTSNSRNWDRKAFLAWIINPQSENNQGYRRQRAYFRSGQTMGFVPVIDSYETWYGGDWSSRKEVVAWGAGAGLVMRVKVMGGKAKEIWEATKDGNSGNINVHRHTISWARYNEKGAVEGRDDITSVNVRPQQGLDDPERMVIGRASGSLSLVSLPQDGLGDQARILVSYETAGRPVRSATVNSGSQPLLVACLSDSIFALYPLDSAHNQVSPVGETSVIPASHNGRTWCSRFLRDDRLAVGFGPAKEPIRVYDIERRELMPGSVRSLALFDADADDRLDMLEVDSISATSIYSLASIPPSSLAGGAEGDTFLSGGYDGFTRLHDLRIPHSTTAVFRDPVDTFSPVYSLLPIGTERFVAGGGRHSIIKVFDLRMPGSKLYHAADLDPCSTERNAHPKQREQLKKSGCCNYHYDARYNRRGWNVFLRLQSNRSRRDSPVYALSRPSQASPSFFAGVESHIIQLDMTSIMDHHPDPVFANGPAKKGNRDDVRRKWDPYRKVVSMPMYEHNSGPVNLIKQRAEVEYAEHSIAPGWDERWSLDSHR